LPLWSAPVSPRQIRHTATAIIPTWKTIAIAATSSKSSRIGNSIPPSSSGQTPARQPVSGENIVQQFVLNLQRFHDMGFAAGRVQTVGIHDMVVIDLDDDFTRRQRHGVGAQRKASVGLGLGGYGDDAGPDRQRGAEDDTRHL